MSNYLTYGPFEIPRQTGVNGEYVLDASIKNIRDFWERVEGIEPGLSSARGCYVFPLERGKESNLGTSDNQRLDSKKNVSNLQS